MQVVKVSDRLILRTVTNLFRQKHSVNVPEAKGSIDNNAYYGRIRGKTIHERLAALAG